MLEGESPHDLRVCESDIGSGEELFANEGLVERAYAAIEQWRLRGERWKQDRELGASARLR
jgi:hypothetical protein